MKRPFEDLKKSLAMAQESRSALVVPHPEDGQPCWVEFERLVMLATVNAIRMGLGKTAHVSYEQIEQAESAAVGHSDYTVKYALGCESLVLED